MRFTKTRHESRALYLEAGVESDEKQGDDDNDSFVAFPFPTHRHERLTTPGPAEESWVLLLLLLRHLVFRSQDGLSCRPVPDLG